MIEMWVGATAAVVAALVASWATLRSRKRTPARISIHDLSISWLSRLGDGGQVMSVDVSVENSGGQPALITRMVINCPSSMKFRQVAEPAAAYFPTVSALPPSSQTEGNLPKPTGEPFTTEVKMSQLVPASGFDRFELLVSVPHPPESDIYLYLIQFCFDQGPHGSIDSEHILVSIPTAPRITGNPMVRDRLSKFLDSVAEMRAEVDAARAVDNLPPLDWSRISSDWGLRHEVEHWLERRYPGARVLGPFWDPSHAVDRYCAERIDQLERLQRLLAGASRVESPANGTMPERTRIARVLAELKELRLTMKARVDNTAPE